MQGITGGEKALGSLPHMQQNLSRHDEGRLLIISSRLGDLDANPQEGGRCDNDDGGYEGDKKLCCDPLKSARLHLDGLLC